MNYFKILQNSQAYSVSVGNRSSEDQLMHIFFNNFHRGGKDNAQIASHQAELRKEENGIDQKSLSITSLQTDYLNIDRSSSSNRKNKRENLVKKKCTFVDMLTILQ